MSGAVVFGLQDESKAGQRIPSLELMTSGVSGAGALLVCATGDVRSLPASGRRARNRSRPLSGSASAWITGPASRCLRQIATDESISERVIRKRAKGDDWSRGWSERNLEKREGGSARTAGTEWLASWRAGRRRGAAQRPASCGRHPPAQWHRRAAAVSTPGPRAVSYTHLTLPTTPYV